MRLPTVAAFLGAAAAVAAAPTIDEENVTIRGFIVQDGYIISTQGVKFGLHGPNLDIRCDFDPNSGRFPQGFFVPCSNPAYHFRVDGTLKTISKEPNAYTRNGYVVTIEKQVGNEKLSGVWRTGPLVCKLGAPGKNITDDTESMFCSEKREIYMTLRPNGGQ